MGSTTTCGIRAAAPPLVVHALLGDVARHPEWAADDLAVEHVGGPRRGPGSQWRTRVSEPFPGVPGVLEADLEVVEERPGELLALVCDSSLGRHRWTWRLNEVAGGTDVAVVVERLGAAPLLGRLQPLLWRAYGRPQLRRALARLAELAAAQPAPRALRLDLTSPDPVRTER